MVLLLASLFFYAWGEPKFVFIMLAMVVIDFAAGIVIEKNRNNVGKTAFITAILVHLGVLFSYKYLTFLCGELQRIKVFKYPKIALPIGISFFTFQMISYLVDVYRGNVQCERNIWNLALYITMFPPLIAASV